MTQTTIAAEVASAPTETTDVVQTVIETVADAEGVEPVELEPLYSVVDPDALESLFGSTLAGAEAAPEVRFVYSGYEVRVTGSGQVALVESADE